MAFETNKVPKLDVMQPILDLEEDLVDEGDEALVKLDILRARIEAIELFLADFGWGE